MEPITVAARNQSGTAGVGSPMAKGMEPTSAPASAPQPANRATDSSSKRRSRAAMLSTTEKATPPMNPGYAPMRSHISSMESSGSTTSPIRTATGAQTIAQTRPIVTAPRTRLTHCFTPASMRGTRSTLHHKVARRKGPPGTGCPRGQCPSSTRARTDPSATRRSKPIPGTN